MKAFHGDPKIKKKYLDRLRAHAKADEIIKGVYWENGKGCAVGCTIHSGNHSDYEKKLGIPAWLALVEDKIFEGLPQEKAKTWPLVFLSAISVGANLEQVKAPFLIFILQSVLDKFNHEKFPKVKKRVLDVIALYENKETDPKKIAAVRAKAATAAAEAAKAEAAWATAEAATATAAAGAAAWAATAWAMAWAAAASEAATAAAGAAGAEYEKFADKLLELLKRMK